MTIPDINRIAALSRIDLSGAEKLEFTSDLISLKEYADILAGLEVPEAPDYADGQTVSFARKDIPANFDALPIILGNAPELSEDGGTFAVPKSL